MPFLTLALLSGCITTLVPILSPKVSHEPDISAEFRYDKQRIAVLDSEMAYVDEGSGAPVVLLHGNPTSSYLWRNVIPHLVADGRRVIAPDLIGMGDSGKPDIGYRFADHVRYVDAFVAALELRDVTWVLHDWGGGIGFDHAMRHADDVRGIAFFEAVLRPGKWSETDAGPRALFKRMRDQQAGDKLLIEDNYFVEKLLPAFSGRALTEEEMAFYRAPYLEPAHRKPARVWPQELPFDGEPADNHERMTATYEALKGSDVPLLLLTADPGAIFTAETVEILRTDFPRMTVEPVGEGLHYLQETSPRAIGTAVSAWIDTLPKSAE
ncbi:MAG: haloalkane dehalogenase [Myxococcales bacterium]|nr:haloalkane dehalogenase [Myxococcales bacterium]